MNPRAAHVRSPISKRELNTDAVPCGKSKKVGGLLERWLTKSTPSSVKGRRARPSSTLNPTLIKNIKQKKIEWESGARGVVRILADRAVEEAEKKKSPTLNPSTTESIERTSINSSMNMAASENYNKALV